MAGQPPDTLARRDLEAIYRAAVDAVSPRRLVERVLAGGTPGGDSVPAIVDGAGRVFLLAVGKAARGMAQALATRLGPKLFRAVVIAPRTPPAAPGGEISPDKRFEVCEAAHPLPDESSERAACAAIAMLEGAGPDDVVVLALSGGASAMMAMPAERLTVADKLATTRLMLRAGVTIREINAVRKHISAVKGGQLLRRIRSSTVLALILSDVPGNDPATIGSGPTAADSSSYADAREVLKKHRLWDQVPQAVRRHLDRGASGEIAETVKPGDDLLARVTNVIVGDNGTALTGAAEAARAAGYTVDRWRELYGEADDLGRALGAHLAAMSRPRLCVIAGGEPVVTVRGPGRGGRAQQCALALAIELARLAAARPIVALLAGTDGIDGPTDAAGAFVDPKTVARAQAARVDVQAALVRNDAYSVFEALGDLFKPGPTGTNTSDILIALVNYRV